MGLSGNTFITNFKANIEAGGGKYESLENSEEIKKKFPYMDFGSDVQALHLSKTSGYLNPRNLVKAQKMIAEKAGCVYVDDVVNSVVRNPSGYYDLTLEKKGRVTSQKVLLSTGGFTHCRDLLPPGIKPDMEQHPETVILVSVILLEICSGNILFLFEIYISVKPMIGSSRYIGKIPLCTFCMIKK